MAAGESLLAPPIPCDYSVSAWWGLILTYFAGRDPAFGIPSLRAAGHSAALASRLRGAFNIFVGAVFFDPLSSLSVATGGALW